MVAKALYSAYAVLREVTDCFFDCQDIRDGPSIKQKTVTDLLEMGQLPQSLSQYPFKTRLLLEGKSKPWPAVKIKQDCCF